MRKVISEKTSEDIFIDELKMFYNNDESVINDVSEKRIRLLLSEYSKNVAPETITIFKEVIVEKLVDKLSPKPGTVPATIKDYEEEAQRICEKHNIPMSALRRTKDKARLFKNVNARADFSKSLRDKFYAPVVEIGKFLNVDHSTVCHYLQK